MKTFTEWFENERREFEASEPATFTDTDEWLMKKGWEACETQFRSGHKGACPTCEPVGELNEELEQLRDLVYDYQKQVIPELMAALEFYASRPIFEEVTKFPGDYHKRDVSDVAEEALKFIKVLL